jgi:hypothetical protein
MVHSPNPTIITDTNNQTGIKFALGETINFGSMEFIADRFGNMSLFPKENDSVVIFVGMVHSRSPSPYTILEESIGEDN